MVNDPLCLLLADERTQFGETCFRHLLQTAEISEQSSLQLFTDTGNRSQFRLEITHRPAFAMIGNSETVRFVANHLYQMQHRGMMVNANWLFAALHKQQLFALGQRSCWQCLKPQLAQRSC